MRNVSVTGLLLTGVMLMSGSVSAQKLDYSVVQVPEEAGVEFMKITKSSDYVYFPKVRKSGRRLQWESNRVLGMMKDGKQIAYLSQRNGSTNIFLTDVDKGGSSVQRTNRTNVNDFSVSPDGKYFVFSEQRGKTSCVFRTSATSGYVCRQITSGDRDYSPVYSYDMKEIFFTRLEQRGASVWGFDIGKNFLASYVPGQAPYSIPGESAFMISRMSVEGRGEIWKVNYETGTEECIVADMGHSFSTPTISPDGKWILFVGDARLPMGKVEYLNTDIFVCRIDGTELQQLTYHPSNDLSPIWSNDGSYIYFISQRGDAEGYPNIWRMKFNY